MRAGRPREEGIASLCRRGGIVSDFYDRWRRELLEAGEKRLWGDAQRAASSSGTGGDHSWW